MDALEQKYDRLCMILRSFGSAAIAFSGGVDSTFLLAAAHQVLGGRVIAVSVDSAFIPRSEIKDASVFCSAHGIRQINISADVLNHPDICRNPANRCYFCKKMLFQAIQEIANHEHLTVAAEGSNADDLNDYRPGIQALKELGIQSPLCDAALTKQEIRSLSHSMHLPTWDKPSAACLASRIPYGDPITADKLHMAEQSEAYLHQLGFRQARVRIHGCIARIEVLPADFEHILQHRTDISEKFRSIGFQYTALDLIGYRTGSLNELL